MSVQGPLDEGKCLCGRTMRLLKLIPFFITAPRCMLQMTVIIPMTISGCREERDLYKYA